MSNQTGQVRIESKTNGDRRQQERVIGLCAFYIVGQLLFS